jgi:hypothetical protein
MIPYVGQPSCNLDVPKGVKSRVLHVDRLNDVISGASLRRSNGESCWSPDKYPLLVLISKPMNRLCLMAMMSGTPRSAYLGMA